MTQILRPWPLHITIDRSKTDTAPLHLQISQAIIAGIRSGRLTPGAPLPGSRDLAKQLEINRKTVQLAYEDLSNRGWVVTEGRRGTFVVPEPPVLICAPAQPNAGTKTKTIATPPSPPRVVPEKPASGMIVMDDGAPDTRLMPATALAQAYRNALQRLSRSNRLAEEYMLGSSPLRQSIATMLNFNRGMATEPGRVCLTRGSQMAIFMAAHILAGPGVLVGIEEPGYSEARGAFRAVGAEIAPLPVDEDGLRTDALEDLCRRRRLACIYVTPHHQYPTSVTLSPQRRRHLLELSERHGFVILEDDYDHEFHFPRASVLPLASLSHEANIVYIGTFSKLLSPHLRSGFLTGPAWFVRRAASMVARIDRQGDSVMELALTDLIQSGALQRHHDRAMRVYDQRRLAFNAMLQQHFGERVRFSVPDGGLAYWVRFDAPFGTSGWAARARGAGIRLLPARPFWTGRPDAQATRIGYAHMTTTEMGEALRRLEAAMRQS